MTVWGSLIDTIQDGKTYQIKQAILEEYQGLRLNTTAMTVFNEHEQQYNIDWKKFNFISNEKTLCCPTIQSVKGNSFYECPNISCKRKITPYPGEKKITCNTCKRKMKVERLNKNINVEVEVVDSRLQQQFVLTFFPKVLSKLFEIENLSIDEIEDKVLDLEKLDIVYNANRKVAISANFHN